MRITLTVFEFTDSIKEITSHSSISNSLPNLSDPAKALIFALTIMAQGNDFIVEVIDKITSAIQQSPFTKAIVWDSDDPNGFKLYSVVSEADISPDRILN